MLYMSFDEREGYQSGCLNAARRRHIRARVTLYKSRNIMKFAS